MILIVRGVGFGLVCSCSIFPNNAARFFRIRGMNRQINETISSPKPISVNPNPEPVNGASGSETRVYGRKRRLKQEALEPVEKDSGKGTTTQKLGNTEEYIDGQLTGNLGEILIRCNNVLYIRGVPEDEELADAEQD